MRGLSKYERGCVNSAANSVISNKLQGKEQNMAVIVGEYNRTDISDKIFEELVVELVAQKELNPEYAMIIPDFSSIQRFIFEDETIYEFTLKNGKSFKLSSIDLMHKVKFDAQFMICTGRVPLGKRNDYCVFLSRVLAAKEVVQTETTREADEVTEIKEAVFRFIEGATIVGQPDDTQFSADSVYEQNGSLYVPSSAIKRIIKRDDKNFTMRHMRVLLNPYLKTSSKVIRLKDKLCRFWVFDMEKLNLPIKMKKVNFDTGNEVT